MFVEIDHGRALFVLLHSAIFGERIEDENDAATLSSDVWQRRWWRVCAFTVPCWASPFPLFSTPGQVLPFCFSFCCLSFVRVDSGRRSVCVISKIISNFVCRNASVGEMWGWCTCRVSLSWVWWIAALPPVYMIMAGILRAPSSGPDFMAWLRNPGRWLGRIS